MSRSVREVTLDVEPPYFREVWRFEGMTSGVRCEIEDIGVWLVSIQPGDLVVEVVKDDSNFSVFLESFDIRPLYLVQSSNRGRTSGWWLRFADGAEFGTKSVIDKLIGSRRGYNEDIYEISRDAELPQVH